MIRVLPADVTRQLQVASGEDGERLDRFVRARVPGSGRAAVAVAIVSGAIRVNGRPARKGQRLRVGDRVEVRGSLCVAAQPDGTVPLVVRLEDPMFLVVDKPAGLPCHPLRPGETATLASALLARYPELAGVGGDPREPGLVHRLDTQTSGLLLVARDRATFAELRRALRSGSLGKSYVARCAPRPESPPLSLGPHRTRLVADRGPRVGVSPAARRAREVVTEVCAYRPLPDGTAVAEVRVHCAARHQVRAHLASLGHPLVGDTLYGGPPRAGGHLLHASRLSLLHPRTGALVTIESPLPDAFTGGQS